MAKPTTPTMPPQKVIQHGRGTSLSEIIGLIAVLLLAFIIGYVLSLPTPQKSHQQVRPPFDDSTLMNHSELKRNN